MTDRTQFVRGFVTALVIVGLGVAGHPVIAGESSDEESGAERQPRVRPVFRRAPEGIRRAPVAFDGELEPVESELAEQLLAPLCPGEPVRMQLRGRSESVWACRRCPQFTSHAGERGPLVLDEMIRGDFTTADARAIFASYRGCEPKRASHGGGLVYRRREGRWAIQYRHPGLYPQACLKFESSEHADRLACRVRFQRDGTTIEKVVDAASGRRVVKLARSVDNSGACSANKFISSYLVSWRREDINGDGRRDLVVEKVQRHEPVPENRDAPVCSLADTDGTWDLARRMTVRFRFTGRRLRLQDRLYDGLPGWARKRVNYARLPSTEDEASEERRDNRRRAGADHSAAGR